MAAQTVAGIFDSIGAARAAQAALVDAGVTKDRIVLSADLAEDAIAAEAPGQSYENQPGQSPGDSATAPYTEAVRGGGCVLSVKTRTQADGRRIEKLMRERGARRTTGYRDSEPPEQPGGGGASSRGTSPGTPGGTPLQRAAPEQSRIAFLVERDGEEAARAWVERTLKLYRDAIATRSHAAHPDYRPMFEDSIRAFEEWLRARQTAA